MSDVFLTPRVPRRFPSHEEQRRGLEGGDGDDASDSLAAHQLALRLGGRLRRMDGGRFNPRRGRAAGHYMRERLPRARHALPIRLQLCALHLDFDDAHRLHGCPLIYALHLEEGVELPQGQEARPMPHSDLVVFERGDGGRCVRVQTACPHHVCVVRVLPGC